MGLTTVRLHNESHLFYDQVFIVGYIPFGYSGYYDNYFGRVVPNSIEGVDL